jgi:hypothetical protein
MDPAALPPMPDPETGLPRPPRAPGRGRPKDAPPKPDPDRVNDPARAPQPPPRQGPVLAWYRSSWRGAIVTGLWVTGLLVLVVSGRDRFHPGSATIETRTAMGLLAVENLLSALSGQRPRCLLNPEALDQ